MKKTKRCKSLLCRITGHQVDPETLQYMNHKQCMRCGDSETDDKYIHKITRYTYLPITGKYDRYGLSEKIGYLFYLLKVNLTNYWRRHIYYRYMSKDLPF